MTATGQDFSMYRGDSKYLHYEVTDIGDLQNKDITWVAAKNGDIIMEKTSNNGEELEVHDNKFIVKLRPKDTLETLTESSYRLEAQIIDNVGHVSTVMKGRLTIQGVIIKPST